MKKMNARKSLLERRLLVELVAGPEVGKRWKRCFGVSVFRCFGGSMGGVSVRKDSKPRRDLELLDDLR
jgi:hypothetical protein